MSVARDETRWSRQGSEGSMKSCGSLLRPKDLMRRDGVLWRGVVRREVSELWRGLFPTKRSVGFGLVGFFRLSSGVSLLTRDRCEPWF